MAISNPHKREVMNHAFRTSSWTKPTELYVALFSSLPNADLVGGVEIAGNGYARVRRDPSDANWLQVVDGVVTNAAVVTFPDPVGGGWGSIVGIGVFDQANVLKHFMFLASAKIVNSDDPGPFFPIGSLQFILSNVS